MFGSGGIAQYEHIEVKQRANTAAKSKSARFRPGQDADALQALGAASNLRRYPVYAPIRCDEAKRAYCRELARHR